MCGIAGFAGIGEEETLRAMTSALGHRGPDAGNFWCDPSRGVFLGHRRLSIVDLGGGSQPMWTPDGEIGIVFNGEIYNHQELRRDLIDRGHIFASDHSDTEVLLHGYREWGEDLPRRLNGMWALAIYDRKAAVLWISRDRFGEKPLYYAATPSAFIFASELHALVRHPALRPTLSTIAVQKYLAFGFIPAPNSIYREVHKLPAGHNLRFDVTTRSISVQQYWDFVLDPGERVSNNAENEYAEELRLLLSRSVKQRLMADVPVGVLLSGGVDSSAIAVLAAQHSPIPIKTFSIGFAEQTFDESTYAQQVAEMIGSDHHTDQLRVDSAIEVMAEALSRLDEPMADASLLPCFLLFRHVAAHVKVALGGDGSDELFAGYDTFRALRWAQLYNRVVPQRLHNPIQLVSGLLPISHRNMSFDFRVKRTLRGLSAGPALWLPSWIGPLSPSELRAVMEEPVNIEEVYEEALLQWENCKQDNLLDRTMQFYTKLYLQDDILTKVDRSSMMHSVEARSPFLDNDLVDFVRRIPSRYKLRGNETKFILKKAVAPLLPRDVVYRPKKGFGVPIGQWMADGGLPVSDQLSIDHLFNGSLVRRWSQEHIGRKADHRSFLWARLVLDRFLVNPSRGALPI
ncbi:asparagine synthase (glutamine-hydrolyzing) [Microvirga puerhi]|uniref:asparagine synthase (glutamine-hydrolyzing) n=1 Tax=Microvirga puerhi TaxID=2876078 RepID=A0ABS7VL58_9HYPH|nr:asparagine synthase (glutamine-hydrolyzing) [Microvirga puerhi]MBZ6076256.1 asparagine synthase (glutamine-hydrolyzing) [Microvirga puerhi]